ITRADHTRALITPTDRRASARATRHSRVRSRNSGIPDTRERTPVTTTARTGGATTAPAGSRTSLFSAFAGLTALAVLLQGLWAGLFLPAGKGGPYEDTWVEVHAHGAEAA